MSTRTGSAGRYGRGSTVKASATDDGAVTPSDSTPLDFDALYIGDGVSGTVTISRDGGATSSPAYAVSGPQTLAVSGNRVMATGTSMTGTIIWQQW